MANPLAKISLQTVYLKSRLNAIPRWVKRMLETAFFAGESKGGAVYKRDAVCYTYTEFLCAEREDQNRNGQAA